MMYEQQRRREDRFLWKLLTFVRRFFVAVGVLTTLLVVLGIYALRGAINEVSPPLPHKMVLTYTFKSGLGETAGDDFFRQKPTLRDLIERLDDAAKDERVQSLVVRVEDIDYAPAQLQELRDAIARFRKSGKPAVAFAEDFGQGSMGGYYLASSFGQIWLQPVGAVSITGFSTETPFAREALEKIGVRADFLHKGIYKSAPETLTETGMTPPHREMMSALVGDIAGQVISGIAQSRNMEAAAAHLAINGAPYTDAEALKMKLVDRLGYYDELMAEMEKNGKPVKLSQYAQSGMTFTLGGESKPKVALIYGTGEIVAHAPRAAVSLSASGMAADKVAQALNDAADDKDVRAIVLRIDSPGGDPVAAETIRHAMVVAKKKGKPVFVSMGAYAASGGYWIASAGDKIVAQPATITGSIGVFGGKVVLAEMWHKLGINWDAVSVGDNARMWSMNAPFSEAQKARFDAMLANIYDAFISRVAEGRKMTREAVEAVAQGRVWTGRQAQEKGLVDELGGLDKTIEIARAAAKLPADAPVEIYSAEKEGLGRVVEMFTDEDASILPSLHEIKADAAREVFTALTR